MSQNPRRVIRASEIGQYTYCGKAWWLSTAEGVAPANTADLARGTAAHAAHGREVIGARALPLIAIALIVIAVLVLISGR